MTESMKKNRNARAIGNNHLKIEESGNCRVSDCCQNKTPVKQNKPEISQPDQNGYYGTFGGRFVPETLMPALVELNDAYTYFQNHLSFQEEFQHYMTSYVGRPTPLYLAKNLGAYLGLSRLYLKREDLNHTGAHKINNALGQALLAKYMGKKRLIAETGAGQHGVAVATAAALLGLNCTVFMGEEDMARQEPNVFRMRLLQAEVRPVKSGSKTLKDATNEALREWIAVLEKTHYVIGSVVGPHPYPKMVRDFQAVIGLEVKEQIMEKEKSLPAYLVACIGGGSNAMGLFAPFISHSDVSLIGVEAGGKGLEGDHHAATLQKGTPGVLHGALSYLLQDENGQIAPVHSISAGLDYPGVGPEHSYLKASNRARYVSATDKEALKAFHLLASQEGILPALESAHALAYLEELAVELNSLGRQHDIVVLNLSGRGDKDLSVLINQGGSSDAKH